MALYGGIELPGKPALENVRRLDLLPMPSINEMMRYGMAIDVEKLDDITRRLTEDIHDLRARICAEIPSEKLDEFIAKSNMDAEDDYLPMNVESTLQMRKLLFDVLGVGNGHQLRLTKTGDVSTGKKQLEARKADHPIVQMVLGYRERSKLKGTYSGKLPLMSVVHPKGDCPVCGLKHFGTTKRIHCEIMTTRTATGRPATKKPNLQNIPVRSAYGREIRSAFVASPGTEMVAVDFSQLELRRLAHRGNVKRMIDVFKRKGDIHLETAMEAFDISDPKMVDKMTQRAPAKNVNFAICLLEGQRVLTDRGLIPIEEIKCCHRLWDGVEFVSHGGVIFKGEQEVITYDGITATRGHKVWVEHETRPIPISKAMAEGRRLVTSGLELAPVRVAGHYVQDDTPKRRLSLRLYEVLKLWRRLGSHDRQYSGREDAQVQVSEQIVCRPACEGVIGTLHRDLPTVLQSKLRQLAELWWSWYRKSFSEYPTLHQLCFDQSATSHLPWRGYRQDRQRLALHAREFATRDALQESSEYQTQCDGQLQGSDINRDGDGGTIVRGVSKYSIIENTRGAFGVCRHPVAGDSQTQTTPKKGKVYDILNAGPRRRFTCEGKLVSNCYGETPQGLYEQLVADTYGKSGIPVPDWLTLEWCNEFMQKWFALYPEVKEYMAREHYRCYRYGCVWSQFGRIRYIPEVRSQHRRVVAAGLRQGGNMGIQGDGADMLKLAQTEIHDHLKGEFRARGIWYWPINEVHDEFMFEVEEGYGEVALTAAEEIMKGVLVDKETGEDYSRVPVEAEGQVLQEWRKE